MSTTLLPRIQTPLTGERPAERGSSAGGKTGIKKKESKRPVTLKLPSINNNGSSSMQGIVEIEWILKIIKQLYEKLNFLNQISPEITTANIELSGEVEDDFQDYFAYLSELKEAIEEEEDEEDIEELEENVTVCAKNVARILTDAVSEDPHLVKAVRKLRGQNNRATNEFLGVIAELYELMQHKLQMTSEEENTMQGKLDELIVQEKDDSGKFRSLKEQLDIERKENSGTISALDAKIARLRRDIKRVGDESQRVYTENMKKWKAEEEARNKHFNDEMAKKKEELTKLQAEFEDKSDTNFTNERKEHNRKYKREAALEDLMNKYDSEIYDLYSKIVELKAVHDDELAEKKKMVEFLDERRREEEAIEAERLKYFSERQATIKRKRVQREAATLLHEMYKAWWLKNNKPAGKKKDGKKK
mmetsp:Transcript_10054/g.16189  ORF Transcript_10054/g.16189 Transcript_10054/m.16189 type:complete len:418 (-) Transcript_10054:194-1447(-)